MIYYTSERNIERFKEIMTEAAMAELERNQIRYNEEKAERKRLKAEQEPTRKEREREKQLPRSESKRRPAVTLRRKRNRIARTSRQINRRK